MTWRGRGAGGGSPTMIGSGLLFSLVGELKSELCTDILGQNFLQTQQFTNVIIFPCTILQKWYVLVFKCQFKHTVSRGQVHDQEAAVSDRTFLLVRSSFFYFSALMVRTQQLTSLHTAALNTLTQTLTLAL